MITDQEIKGLMRKFIVSSNALSSLSGKIITTTRPDNSGKEDAVISVLDNHNDEIQQVTINVNVYVPDINPKGYYEEDGIRLKDLCIICKDLFEKKSLDLLLFKEYQQKVYKNESTSEHFINNKIIYKFNNE